MAALGATYGGSNEFVDAELTLGEEHFENIRALINSARKQGHHGIEIRLTPESFSAIQSRVMELAVLEDAEVNTKFYGEHMGREIIVVTFPNAKHKWLFESADQFLAWFAKQRPKSYRRFQAWNRKRTRTKTSRELRRLKLVALAPRVAAR